MIPTPYDAKRDELRELASLLAAAFIRLLASRKAAQDSKNPLDSLDQPSDELAMRTPRRSRRA